MNNYDMIKSLYGGNGNSYNYEYEVKEDEDKIKITASMELNKDSKIAMNLLQKSIEAKTSPLTKVLNKQIREYYKSNE